MFKSVIMPRAFNFPAKKALEIYFQALGDFAQRNISHETAVRSAFQTLLDDCARQVGWKLVPEYPLVRRGRTPLRADGALVDEFNLSHGLWEAKDTADDLDKEIQRKFQIGYPQRNILFQSSIRAVLYQNGDRILDTSLLKAEQITDILRAFLNYEEPAIEEWEKASAEFKERIAEHGQALTVLLIKEQKKNPVFKRTFAEFVTLCRSSINPNLSEAAVQEMLVQHLLTWRIFKGVFGIGDFMQRNVIAQEIEKVVLTIRAFSREDFLKSLNPFYTALEHAGRTITDFSEKQKFLNTVYERFFQGFAVKQADTLGIVYTPQPIVDFMVASVELLLEREFGKSLGHKNVHILDGFTGTGNFIVNLMQAIPRPALEHKYRGELHCNEVMLLPYYVASMNIEHAYWEAMERYEPFEGICLVDTFETMESAQGQLGFMNEANSQRVIRQKQAPVFVCIGNPPYNAWQVDENDNNRNRKYRVVDERVRETYGDASAAQNRNSLSDPYIKAIRWASDRVIANGDGIVAFVTNNAFVDSLSCDGVREYLARDFDEIRILDLGGNVRRNPKLSGTTHNVFGIQVGVSVSFFVRLPREKKGKRQARIYYYAIPADWRRTEKYRWLEETGDLTKVPWQEIKPDPRNNWLQDGLREEFETFLPLGDRSVLGQNTKTPPVFRHFSRGVATSRDAWAVNFQREALDTNIRCMIENYNTEVQRWYRANNRPKRLEDFLDFDPAKISWSESLKKELERGKLIEFETERIRSSLYRPFTRTWLYFDKQVNERRYGFDEIFPTTNVENICICATDAGSEKPFLVLATKCIADLHLVGGGASAQCFPFYVYDKDGTNRRDNIPLSTLIRFQTEYGDDKITRWDIFYYVYALLHHPGYRERFAANMKRELPRIPLAPEFRALAEIGKQIADLHIDYEEVKEFTGLRQKVNKDVPWTLHVEEKMRWLDADKTTLRYNDALTLENIPCEVHQYRLGNRSALDWVVNQYYPDTDARSGIENDPNRSDDEGYILRLIRQVITVSLQTLTLVQSLPEEIDMGGDPSPEDKQLEEWRLTKSLTNSESARQQLERVNSQTDAQSESDLILSGASSLTGREKKTTSSRLKSI